MYSEVFQFFVSLLFPVEFALIPSPVCVFFFLRTTLRAVSCFEDLLYGLFRVDVNAEFFYL